MPNSPFLAPERDPAFKVGRAKASGGTIYYTVPGIYIFGFTTVAIAAANTDQYAPWYARTPIVIDQLAAEVTASAGTNFRIGFYAADVDWQPVGAPLADSGNLSSATNGVKTYTPGSPIFVPRGRYVSVVNCDNTPTFRMVRGVPEGVPIDPAMGTNSFIVTLGVGRTLAAFPTPGTAWTTATTGSIVSSPVLYRITQP